VNDLRDDLYGGIIGTTDSEHAFMVFLNFLESSTTTSEEYEDPHELMSAMQKTIAKIIEIQHKKKIETKSSLNFAGFDKSILALYSTVVPVSCGMCHPQITTTKIVTDGQTTLVARYSDDPNENPSLYFRCVT